VVVELVRSLVVASVVAGLAELLDIADWTGAVQLGFALWIGFPVVLWTGGSGRGARRLLGVRWSVKSKAKAASTGKLGMFQASRAASR
jgi:hypothetical protein